MNEIVKNKKTQGFNDDVSESYSGFAPLFFSTTAKLIIGTEILNTEFFT